MKSHSPFVSSEVETRLRERLSTSLEANGFFADGVRQ